MLVRRLLIGLVLFLVSGCATKRNFYLDENVEINLLRRIAVLPFVNYTQTKFVESRMRDVVTTEILSLGLFDVVADGTIRRFLKD